MVDVLEVGAVNEIKTSYKAMITGIENPCNLEFWIEATMEVIWKNFTFSFNILKDERGDILDHSNSRELCNVLGLDTDYMLNRVVYGKENIVNRYHYPIKELDEELFIGKEIGVIVGERNGNFRIEGFIPISELSTMPVPD